MRTWKRRAALLAALALSQCLCAGGGDQSSDGEWEGGFAPLESTELEAVDNSYEDGWEFESESDSFPPGFPLYTFSDGVLTVSGSGEVFKGGLEGGGWQQTVANATLETDSKKIDAAVEKVIIEDGITAIGHTAFFECSNLTEVTLPNSLIKIDKAAFRFTGLTSVVIPDSVTCFGEDIFADCDNLNSITFPSNLIEMPIGIVASCPSLTSVQIPASVITFGNVWLYDTFPTELIFEGDITIDQVPNALYDLADFKTPITVYAHSGTLIETWITQKLPELCAEKGKTCNVTFVAL